jgi:hypothetical protein
LEYSKTKICQPLNVVEQNIKNGLYDEEILNKFDDETWLNDIVDHSNDSNLLLHLIKKMSILKIDIMDMFMKLHNIHLL